ncbi:MAG: hypothetical protein AAGG48_15715 [Planctomycetota bacterium]
MRKRLGNLLLLMFVTYAHAMLSAEDADTQGFEFRNFGAFRASAWVGELAIPLDDTNVHRNTWYVAPRAGGVWKTTNNGTTFECITDGLGTTYIGDVEAAPSNPDIVWVGTGDVFNARSSYYGNGIWKSTDGGSTWTNMGLEKSSHIAKIIIHPTNPDIVWVAVMGNLFSENEERGVYRTQDGGKTWTKTLYIDADTGVIDMVLNPLDTNVLYASSYQKVRLPWTFEPGGEKSRIYRSTDGGQSWNVLQGGGFPDGPLGRIGIDVQHNHPDVLVAVVQNLNLKEGVNPNASVPFDAFTDHSFDNLIGGECYRSLDAGKTWERLNDPNKIDVSGKAAYSFNKICIDPEDADKIFIIGTGMYYTLDGGKTWPTGREADRFKTNFGDNRTLWIDPRDGDHMFLGSDGGIYQTWDGGKSMMHYHHLPLGEIYMVEVDDHEPYNLYIGLQDHETWKAPSNNWSGSIGDEDWVIVGMWDGMYCRVDHEDNRWLYSTTQFGSHLRVNQRTGERDRIAPTPPEGAEPYRYTWNTPILISPHDSHVLYTGGQMLLRSPDRGDTWEEVSPDLTDNDKDKIAGTGHIMYCTIASIDESPIAEGVIWIGTDDGRIHLTRNGGESWKEFTDDLETLGMPHERWTARVVASKHLASRAFIAKNGYRNDDMKPYLYATDDFGNEWRDLSAGLPDYPINVVFEDHKNPDLLFVGNDIGVFYTLDRGESWTQLKANLPPVVIRDLLVHPRDGDLIVGTYGRGAWVGDISPLQQMDQDVTNRPFHLFDIEPKPSMNRSQQAQWGDYEIKGNNQLRTPNEPNGLEIWFRFRSSSVEQARLEIKNAEGKLVHEQQIKAKEGLSKTYWNPRRSAPGDYQVSLNYQGETITKPAQVKERWRWPVLNYRDKN